jgi:hypothetical protein
VLPFTRRVDVRATASTTGGAAVVRTVSGGEPKNETPFTGAAPVPGQVRGGDGFDWGDAGIGAAAMLGIVAIALGRATVRASTRGPAQTTSA